MGIGCEAIDAPTAAPEERAMRKWLVTLMVLGVGGVGTFLLTDKGQEALRRRLARFEQTPERWGDWNQNAQRELEYIQAALNHIAHSLEPRGEPGH
jgi:DNA-binding PadR family transcriptional regulator